MTRQPLVHRHAGSESSVPPGQRSTMHSHSLPTSVAAVIRRVMAQAGTPGLSIAVTSRDRLLYADGYGYADLATGAPAGPGTAYLWFSMSKIATATAALALADAGSLDLDAPIDQYLPGDILPHWRGSRPSVRHLLNHTAGFGNPPPIRWVHPATAAPPEPEQFRRRRLRLGIAIMTNGTKTVDHDTICAAIASLGT